MNILMMTNTYKPLVGGLERSVEVFAREFRKRSHRVIIVAPEFGRMEPEEDVIRVPAVQNFNGSDFSVQLPVSGTLTEALGDFKPHIIHSHHPFLIGDTALRAASRYNVPLVFTHHTLYEENVHYVPGNEEALKRFVIELSTGYANLSDQVFAPSESVMHLLRERGVQSPIDIVPTGIYTGRFTRGAGKSFRRKFNIPGDAFVIGHLGRLAPEKNLEFLVRAVTQFLKKNSNARLMIAGQGPSEETILNLVAKEGMSSRLHWMGVLEGNDLVDAYHAMNVFVFASQSETQGLVLTEALAAGTPVVAVDAPGVREVVKEKINGRLLAHESIEDFVGALEWISNQTICQLKTLKKNCKETAADFSMDNCVNKALARYSAMVVDGFIRRPAEDSAWAGTLRLIRAQWELVKNLTRATSVMMAGPDGRGEHESF
jgi:1,2-diacylglycerol 3-alpha-glucosyltransferase